MVTKAWKSLELYVAKHLNGKRLVRPDFSKSQPDVIVKTSDLFTPSKIKLYAEDVLSCWVLPTVGTWLIECKYSKNQPWHQLIDSEGISIGKGSKQQFIFWTLEKTRHLFHTQLLPIRFGAMSIDMLLRDVRVIDIPRKVPKYLETAFDQSLGYMTTWKAEKPVLPLVCLGLKGKQTRVLYTSLNCLVSWLDEQ